MKTLIFNGSPVNNLEAIENTKQIALLFNGFAES